MIYLKKFSRPESGQSECFPWTLPFIPSITEIEIAKDILFFVGENGSGKSSLLESVAIASKQINIGGTDLQMDRSLDEIRPLALSLRLSWGQRTRRGFFLRAEDFFGFIRRNTYLEAEFDGYIERFRDDDRVRAYMEANKEAINARYGRDLNGYSHGEGFLEFFKARIVPGGLYLIDEPEAALSPQRQLAFTLLVRDMSKRGCQFIIATHSPIILSAPDSQIWEFSETGISDRQYDELEHIQFSRAFLGNPESYWHRLG